MSIYPAGQCTDYAATRLPWINAAGNLGNALNWARNWKGPKSTTPAAGTVAVFQPGWGGASGTGHVAVVESVQPDGTFTISEQNFESGPGTGLGKTDIRSGVKNGLGVTFLYPASGTSSTGVSALAPGVKAATVGFDWNPFDLIGGTIGKVVGTVFGFMQMGLGLGLTLVGLYLTAKELPGVQAAAAPVKAAANVVPIPGTKAAKAVKRTAASTASKQAAAHERDISGAERKYLADKRAEVAQASAEREKHKVKAAKIQRDLYRPSAKQRRSGVKASEVPF